MPIHTPSQIRKALKIAARIEILQTLLSRILFGVGPAKGSEFTGELDVEILGNLVGPPEEPTGAVSSTHAPIASKPKKKRKMSTAGRAKIAAAQKARWAKVRAGKKRVGKKGEEDFNGQGPPGKGSRKKTRAKKV